VTTNGTNGHRKRHETKQHAETITQAKLDDALSALSDLVRYVRNVDGWMEHEDQLVLRRAEAVLAENGRRVER